MLMHENIFLFRNKLRNWAWNSLLVWLNERLDMETEAGMGGLTLVLIPGYANLATQSFESRLEVLNIMRMLKSRCFETRSSSSSSSYFSFCANSNNNNTVHQRRAKHISWLERAVRLICSVIHFGEETSAIPWNVYPILWLMLPPPECSNSLLSPKKENMLFLANYPPSPPHHAIPPPTHTEYTNGRRLRYYLVDYSMCSWQDSPQSLFLLSSSLSSSPPPLSS